MEVENKIKVRLAGTIRVALQKLEVKTRHKKLSDPWQHMCTQIPVRNGIKSLCIKDGGTTIIKYTPSIPEIIWVIEGNCGLWVRNEILKKTYPENLKKIVGAVWELPAKQHSQSSPI